MPVPSRLRRCLCLAAVLAGLTEIAPAQSDNPTADLLLNPDDVVTVAYALYGGLEHRQSHYANVTDRIDSLLQKSPGGFPVTEEAVLGVPASKRYQSLLILYTYQQRSYFFNMLEGAGSVSVKDLKKDAELRPSRIATIPPPETAGDSFRIVFSTYGVADTFTDVTDTIRGLLRNEPDGFYAHEDVMGGDPHFGLQKSLIIVFDDASGRHFFTQVNTGPLINKAVLLDSVYSN